MKAADRIPGLRPKPKAIRGAPPAWVDWIHKFGPLLTAIVSAAIFFGTLRYTIEPVYRRALLEEANARLEKDRISLVQASEQLRKEIDNADKKLLLQALEVNAAVEKLVMIERQINTAELARGVAEKRVTELSKQITTHKESIATLSTDLARKKDALSQAEAAISNKDVNLENSLVRSIEGMLTAHQLPCSVNAVDLFFVKSPKFDKQFASGCVSSTLSDARIPLNTLAPTRITQLRDLAIEVDLTYESSRLALAREARRLEAQEAAERSVRDNFPDAHGAQASEDNSTEQVLSRYRSRQGEIERTHARAMKLHEDKSKFMDQAHAFVRKVHEDFFARLKAAR